MTAGRGSPMNVPMDAADGSAPMTVLFETDQHRDTKEDNQQKLRKGLKRPRTPLQSKSSIGQLARLVSRDFSSDACDHIMTDGRNSIGSDSIEDGIRERTLMPPPRSVSDVDGGVHKNLYIRATTPSPIREELEFDEVRTPNSIAPGLTIELDCGATEALGIEGGDHKKTSSQITSSPAQVGDAESKVDIDSPWDTSSIKDTLLRCHLNSMRLEKSLIPLRPLLSRLMSHSTYNQKGLFNKPVDPEALGLLDYRSIISRPMDLGTVKTKLHALTYQSLDEAVEDVRLVFKNAMAYNPPANPVHIAAKALLEVFEHGYATIVAAAAMAEQAKAAKTSLAAVPPSVPSSSHGTAASAAFQSKPAVVVPAHKNPVHNHSCQTCKGKTCPMCLQTCLHLEPAVLICAGSHCAGAKIRRGAQYHSSPDGSRCWCHHCYTGLSAILPAEDDDHKGVETTRYKRNLIKRKNDEEVVEDWIECISCHMAVHKVCAMFNEDKSDPSEFICLLCAENSHGGNHAENMNANVALPGQVSFMSGADLPMEIPTIESKSKLADTDAQSLPTDPLSSFLERKVRQRMVAEGCPPKAEQTVVVRTVSDCAKEFRVPEVVRRHFHMKTSSTGSANGTNVASETEVKSRPCLTKESCGFVPPPEVVPYQSKAIALFQRIDGVDICIFCMYVQEYDKTTIPEEKECNFVGQNKRVYVAYLDSVEHFRPRRCRTAVYQEMLVAYLAASRARGYESAHIWACPPSRGNSFVFWVHPSCQRTPTRDRLERWYHQALSRAASVGVITNVRSLYEVVYEENCSDQDKAKPSKSAESICPPLLDGDYWIEEAVLLHQAHLARYLKIKPSVKNQVLLQQKTDFGVAQCATASSCPTLQVASLLEHRIFANTLSLPFQRPVNAAALNLHDYHDIVTRPMDLGTVHIRCLLGDYENLAEMVGDVELAVRNATRYNPPGHIVHNMALDLKKLFFTELDQLAEWWTKNGVKDLLETEKKEHLQDNSMAKVRESSWEVYEEISMRLGAVIDIEWTSAEKTDTKQCKSDFTSQDFKHAATGTTQDNDFQGMQHDDPRIHQETPDQNNETAFSLAPAVTFNIAKNCVPSNKRGSCPSNRNPRSTNSAPSPKPFSPCSSSSNLSPAKRQRETNPISDAKSMGDAAGYHHPKKRNLGTLNSSSVNLPSNSRNSKAPLVVPDLHTGGPEAVARRMVGSDTWMLERKHAHSSCPPLPHANNGSKKKKNGKKKAASGLKKEGKIPSTPVPKGQRKESWLGNEVSEVLRRMRRDFFVCDLRPREGQSDDLGMCDARCHFDFYMEGSSFKEDKNDLSGHSAEIQRSTISPRIADARHALLEFSQRSHLQFDTLRRAKYSTAILLHQLHSQDHETSGLIPSCTSCGGDICGVRWHKTRRAVDGNNHKRMPLSAVAKTKVQYSKEWNPQELCVGCFSSSSNQENFISLRVSFRRVAS